MQLIIVTGLSGGGKSIAVRQLEDSGFYCIDNLPGEFLLPVAKSLAASGTRAAARALRPWRSTHARTRPSTRRSRRLRN